MSLQLSDLELTPDEFYQASGIPWDDSFTYSLQLLKLGARRETLMAFLWLQAVIYLISLVFSFPVILLLLKRLTRFSDQAILIMIMIIGILVGLIVNVFLRRQAQDLASFFRLKNQVEGYQQVIQQFSLLEKLANLEHQEAREREQMYQILMTLKQNLLSALKTEHLLRKHRILSKEKRSFLVELENNLASLMSQQNYWQEGAYVKVYNEVLAVSEEVYRQIQSWRSLGS